MSILQEAMDSHISGVIVLDQASAIIEVNQVLADIFEYSKEELIGEALGKIIPPNLNQDSQKLKTEFDLDKTVKSGLTKVGAELWVEFREAPYNTKEGNYRIISIVDITKEHKIQKLLARTQEVARIGSWHLDIIENKLMWSKITYEIHEVDYDEEVLIQEGINFYAKEHQPIIKKYIDASINKKESWNVELKIVTAKGREKWVRAIGSPIIESDQVVGLEGTFQDIDKQKLMQIEREKILQKLKKTEVNLSSLADRHGLALEASGIGVQEWNIVSDELIWDAQMYKIYGVEQSDSKKPVEVMLKGIHPEEIRKPIDLLNEAMENNNRLDITFRIYCPSGELRYIRALASLFLDDEGSPIKIVGVNWDITESIENEKKLFQTNISLERANDELTQFAYRSSHDLKSPLISIRRLAELILEDLEDSEIDEVKKNVNEIIKQSTTLENLVQDLLNLSKADLESEKEEIDFLKLLKDVISLNTILADQNKVKCNSHVTVTNTFHFPKVRILQILNNLISNSIKYCDENKNDRYVNIEIYEKNDNVIIRVDDNGMGIPYKNKDDVFKMFKRFHTNKITGSGIGMYILKKHVDSLNGEISFESNENGTQFLIILKRM